MIYVNRKVLYGMIVISELCGLVGGMLFTWWFIC